MLLNVPRRTLKLIIASVDIRLGDLFDPVDDEKFDLILFNTPYLPTDEEEIIDDELEAAWNGGKDGKIGY